MCLGLFPAAAAAQGSIGPLTDFSTSGIVNGSIRAGSRVFYTTYTPNYPPQPYTLGFLSTDGTSQGTVSLGGKSVQFVDVLGDLLYFKSPKTATPAEPALFRSDGTVAGTFPLTEDPDLVLLEVGGDHPVTAPVPERHLEFFSASPKSGDPNFELWATDGTPAGTRLVKDVNPAGSSNPGRMTAFAGRLFFFADTPQGRQLWRSDGTAEGTARLDVPFDFPASYNLVPAGGALFFTAYVGSYLEVWRLDDTEEGIDRVLVVPGQLRGTAVAGRHLFLVTAGETPTDREIWVVDVEGTEYARRVLEAESFQEIFLMPVGGAVAFFLEDDRGTEPWWSDGTPAGTRRIADLCPGSCGSFQQFLGVYGRRAVFLADDGVSGAEPWMTDGTAAGTWRLEDLCPGACSTFDVQVREVNGWLALVAGGVLRISDGTPNGAWSPGSLTTGDMDLLALPDRILFASSIGVGWSLPVTAAAPQPGPWMESTRVPGFRFKSQIGGPVPGRQESACPASTLCVSGAVPGRSEVFLRVSEPKPDGRVWPSMIKLTPSAADVWVIQKATGLLRNYKLTGTGAASSTLAGLLDRVGFLSSPAGLAEATSPAKAKPPKDPQPPGRWIESATVPGFRVQARMTSAGASRVLTKAPCIAETFCLAGATAGVTDLFVRVPGPKPNGYFWPTMARFAPATLEVWVQQRKTGKIRYYKLNAPPADSSQLDGYFDRLGFKR